MERLGRSIPRAALDITTRTIIGDMEAYFADSAAEHVTMDPFFVYFCMRHPTLTETQRELYKARLATALEGEADPALERGLLGRLVQAEAASKVTDVITRWNDGAEIDLYHALRSEVESLERALDKKAVVPWVTDSISEILNEDIGDRGLRWRLEGFNEVMRPLRGGDFVIYAGRVGKGKTTGVASEITFMAPQFEEYYGDAHGRYVVWLCNEGPGKRIVSRIYQSALNATMSDLIHWTQDKTLESKYAAAIGALDRIRVMNIHGFTSHQVEGILQRVNPGLIIGDMWDNVTFTGDTTNGGERTDEKLEGAYQWGRMLGVKYDCPVIATSQTSGDAAGKQWPSEHMLKDSKTGKQGAADLMVMMGSVDEYPNSRFLSIPKTKLARQGAPAYPKWETLFDAERGRLLMPQEEK